MTRRIFAILPLCLLIVVVSLPVHAGNTEGQAADHPEPLQVELTIRVGSMEDGKREPRREYDVIAINGQQSEFVSGGRVPIPTTSFNTSNGNEAVPMTAFTYQNVGFSAQLQVWVDGDAIRLDANIEDSHLSEQPAVQERPIIATHQQRVHAILEDGVPLQLTRAQGCDGWDRCTTRSRPRF